MIIFVFFNFLAFWPFPWQRQPFWNRGNFENFKNKEHNFEWWSICVKFQKDPLYGVNLTCFPPWLTWQRPQFRICSTPQKLPHTTVHIPTKLHEVWWKESKHFLNPPFFCFHVNCGKVCPTDSNFFGLSRSTRSGCCSYQVSSISVRSYDVSWSLMKEIKMKRMIGIQFIFKSHLFVSMATAANLPNRFQLFLTYLVPLDVDVLPIKFHQFLFGE